MNKELEYAIVIADSPVFLREIVQENLDKGWNLQGGVSVSALFSRNTDAHYTWAQAMVRYVHEEKGDEHEQKGLS